MLNLSKELQEAAAAAIKAVFDIEVEAHTLTVQETRKDFEGDLTIVVFPLTRYKLGAPHIIADRLGQYLVEQLEMVSGYSVVKGFLNLVINPSFWLKFVASYHEQDDFFQLKEGEGEKTDKSPRAVGDIPALPLSTFPPGGDDSNLFISD